MLCRKRVGLSQGSKKVIWCQEDQTSHSPQASSNKQENEEPNPRVANAAALDTVGIVDVGLGADDVPLLVAEAVLLIIEVGPYPTEDVGSPDAVVVVKVNDSPGAVGELVDGALV